MIVYGKRICGRVDRVPGVLYVATQFFHLYFIPVAPVDSFIVVEGSEGKDGFKGVKTKFSARSIVATYCKTLLFLSGCVMLFVGSLQACGAPSDTSPTASGTFWYLAFLVLGAASIAACFIWRPWSLATEPRGRELAIQMGIPTEAIDAGLIERKHEMHP
jgi:hypothetical protein